MFMDGLNRVCQYWSLIYLESLKEIDAFCCFSTFSNGSNLVVFVFSLLKTLTRLKTDLDFK